MGPFGVGELDLPSLGQLESFQVHLIHQITVKWNVESSIFHCVFQVAQNVLLLRQSENFPAGIFQASSYDDVFHEGLSNSCLVYENPSEVSQSFVQQSEKADN